MLKFINRLKDRVKNKNKRILYLPDFGAISSSQTNSRQGFRKSLNLLGFKNPGKNKENISSLKTALEEHFKLNKEKLEDQLLQAKDQAHAPADFQVKTMKGDEEVNQELQRELKDLLGLRPLSDQEAMKKSTRLYGQELSLGEPKARVSSDKDKNAKFGNKVSGISSKKGAYSKSYTTPVEIIAVKPTQDNLG